MISLAGIVPVAIAAEPPAVEITHLKGPLYKVTARADYEVNFVASAGKDGVLLVDTGFKQTAGELKEKLAALGKGPVRYVVNTHAHVDHTGGNGAFGKDAVVIAHDVVRQALQHGRYIIEEYPDDALPDITFKDNLTLYFNGEEIRLVALPGSHSDSDIIVVFTGSRVAYLGDLAYGGKFPSVDLRCGDSTRYAEVVRKAIGYLPRGVTIISGHGGDSTREEFVQYQHMLQETTAIVLKGLAAGKTLSEMQKDKVLRDWESHGDLYVTTDEWIEGLVLGARRGPAKASLIEPLYHAYTDRGIEGAVDTYHELKKKSPDTYLFHRFVLYMFGSWLVEKHRLDDAARVFETNIEEYPGFSSNHEMLGEIFMKMGKNDKALESFTRALELDPENEAAAGMIRKIQEER